MTASRLVQDKVYVDVCLLPCKINNIPKCSTAFLRVSTDRYLFNSNIRSTFQDRVRAVDHARCTPESAHVLLGLVLVHPYAAAFLKIALHTNPPTCTILAMLSIYQIDAYANYRVSRTICRRHPHLVVLRVHFGPPLRVHMAVKMVGSPFFFSSE